MTTATMQEATTGAGQRVLEWSMFKGARDNQPTKRSGTWTDLVTLLTTVNATPKHPDLAEAKKAVPAFSGTIFAEGTTRGVANAEAIHLLVFDFDNTQEEPIPGERHKSGRPKTHKVPIEKPAQPDTVALALDRRGLAAVVYTTWSSSDALRKFRVVVPLASPIPPDLWTEATEWAMDHLGFQAWRDSGAIDIPVLRDTARLNFLPCAPDPESVVAAEVEGAFLTIPLEALATFVIQERPKPTWQTPRPKTNPATGRDWWADFNIDFSTLNLEGLIQDMGIEVGKVKSYGESQKWRCHCPWADEHTHGLDDDCAVIIQTPGRWPSWSCSHSSHALLGLREVCEAAGAKMLKLHANAYTPGSGMGIEDASRVDRSDVGNANLMIELTGGDLRYSPELDLWLWWDGSRWIADHHKARATDAAKLVSEHYRPELERLIERASSLLLDPDERKKQQKVVDKMERWVLNCRNRRSLDAILELASRDSRIAVSASELDTDPWLLGVENGVVDLRTGQFRPTARDEFVTKRSPVAFDPYAKAPRWEQFIQEITGKPLPVEYDEDAEPIPATVGRYEPRPKFAAYIQRALGYCMTGSTAEQKMFIAFGAGSNGKNVMLDIVQKFMGDYCRTIPPESLMASKHDADPERPTSIAASLAGARMAVSSESREGQKLNVSVAKRHTGGGYLVARGVYEKSFRFEISHKLWLMTNCKPGLDHLDDALRGRLHLIPFDRAWNRPGHTERDKSLPDGDKDLPRTLNEEAPGILTWLIDGAVKYLREGLEPPAEVLGETQSYFATEDPVNQWLEGYDRCDPKHGGSLASELFRQFENWKLHNQFMQGGPRNANAFGRVLENRYQVRKGRTTPGVAYGLTPKPVDFQGER